MMNDNWDKIDAFAGAMLTHVANAVAHITAAERATWNAKQAALTFDGAPTAGSSNPVISAGIKTALDEKAPTNHASSSDTYGKGTDASYGHVKLSDSTTGTSDTSGGTAATPKAVKAVKDAIPSAYTSNPAMNGTASAGSSANWARGDHVHPKDTSKADQSELNTFVRPNLLDNAYFVGGGSQQGGGQFPVNQRGKTSYAINGPTIDRWKTANLTSYGTVAINNNGLTLTHAVDGGYMDFYQALENAQDITGKTVTASSIIDNTLYSTTFTFGDSGIFAWGGIQFICNASAFVLRVDNQTGITIKALKLELGDTQTLAHWNEAAQEWVLNEVPNYQQELAKCQRHLVKLNMANSIYPTFGGNVAVNSGFVYITIELPEEMRTAPAIVLSNTVDTYYVTDGLTNFNLSSMTLDRFMGDRLKIACRTTGLTPGQFYSIEAVSAESIIFTT